MMVKSFDETLVQARKPCLTALNPEAISCISSVSPQSRISPIYRALSLLFLATFALPTFSADSALEVALSLAPDPLFIERMSDAQHLNFDHLVENRSDVAINIDRIELSVMDRDGKLLLRRFVDGNGVRPSIEAFGERRIEVGKTRTVFNPFHPLANELDLATLRFQFDVSNADGSRRLQQFIEVKLRAYCNHADYFLPVIGLIVNHDGHDVLGHHRRFDVQFEPIAQMECKRNAMRYSSDFVHVGASGAMSKGEGTDNANWFSFGKPVSAIGDGVVVAVENSQPDNRQFDQSKLATDRVALFGNYVVIDHGGGEFGVYAQTQLDSVQVNVGETVKSGQAIASIGASGGASFPHLHFQLQNGLDRDAEALPSYFNKFARVLGERRVARERASIDSGEIVEAD